tara:strand:- start:299 stop:805 length:507 start_codon:yes stop_codon:yes gene_type:complete
MPINTTIVEASLQAALDATTSATATKDMLLLTKAVEAIGAAVTNIAALTAELNANDYVVKKAELKDYSETTVAMAADDCDLELGNVFTKAISSSTTLTFSNAPASGKAGAFTLIATLSGSPAITWPATVKWAGGTAPILTPAGIDIFTFMTTDNGTAWFGFSSGENMQ